MNKADPTIIERYRESTVKLNELCAYINNRALIISALNVKFTPEEHAILKIVQKMLDETNELIIDIDNSGNAYDDLKVDYEIYQLECLKCNGILKVDSFMRNDLGHRYNVYKCISCGEKTQDMYPNKYEHVLEHFKAMNDFFDRLFADKNVKEEVKKPFRKQYKDYKKHEKAAIASSKDFDEKKEAQRENILTTIEKNNELYNGLLKFKHHFDRNIGEA